MPSLPKSTTTVSDTAGAQASGSDVCCVISPCVGVAIDNVRPTRYGKAAALYADVGYCEGVEYVALHVAATGRPVLFVGVPIAIPGTISRIDMSGNTGTSVVSVVAGGSGVLGEHCGYVEVDEGGTVGASQIVLLVSLDGGETVKRIRVGTGNSYGNPYIGASIVLGAGTLVKGDVVLRWFGAAPRADATGLAAAFTALGGGMKFFRSSVLCGDVQNASEGNAYLAQLAAYESARERFVYGRASVRDRAPLAKMSRTRVRMSTPGTLTFAASGNTVTRTVGSWLTDGFAVGDLATVLNTVSNNITDRAVSALSATVMTLAAPPLVNEVAPSTVVVTSVGIVNVSEAGASDTIAIQRGSFLTDGFKVGQQILVAGFGNAANNGVRTLTAVSAQLLTFVGGSLVNETISQMAASITAAQSKAQWMSELDAAFETVNGRHINLSAGRGRVTSPFSGWAFRRPAGWAASLLEYAPGDRMHRTTWEKGRGAIVGWSLEDNAKNPVEWDDRADGEAASLARFTSFRSWGNGPAGAFIAQDVNRADEGSLLQERADVAVLHEAMTIVQLNSENAAIGVSLVLNEDGTATSGSLSTVSDQVNAALARMLQNRGFGPHASKVLWTPSADDVYNIPEAIMTGVLELILNGIVHSVETTVRIRTGGN